MKLKLIAAIIAAISVLLIVGGFVSPPLGVIDGSVITSVGFLLAFNALFLVWYGIDNGWGARYEHNGTVVTLSKENEDDNTD